MGIGLYISDNAKFVVKHIKQKIHCKSYAGRSSVGEYIKQGSKQYMTNEKGGKCREFEDE